MDDPLLDAQRHLTARSATADEAGKHADARLLEALAGAVDHVRRVALEGPGQFYRCEKAGVLVSEALTVQRLTFEALAVWPEEGSWEADRIDEAADVLTGLLPAVRAVMWATCQGQLATRSVARQAAEAAAGAEAWAVGVTATAVPDDEDRG